MSQESLYKRRIQEGLCGSCGKESIKPGESLGPICLEKSRLKAAAKRDKQRAAGLCIESGCKNKATHSNRCDYHTEYQKQVRQKSTDRKKAAGICVQTGCYMKAKEGCISCQKHITDASETTSEHYRRQRDGGLCGWVGCKNIPDRPGGAYCVEHRQADAERKLQYKMESLKAYSATDPPSCMLCSILRPGQSPETDPDILEIDHIEGGGNKHRREIGKGRNDGGGGSNFYRWLRNNNFPPGYRVACPTCNKKAYQLSRTGKLITAEGVIIDAKMQTT